MRKGQVMDVHHAAAFLALAEELHFGRAAQRLRMAQPALSRLIKGLENDLGAALFERSTRHVALTPAGEALMDVARELVKRGITPVYREGVVTDNGNQILDCYDFLIEDPQRTEADLNNIVGVVTNGLFAARGADVLLLGTERGVERITT